MSVGANVFMVGEVGLPSRVQWGMLDALKDMFEGRVCGNTIRPMPMSITGLATSMITAVEFV